MNNLCKTCAHWKTEQADLEYAKDRGICTSPQHGYTIDNESACMVLDRHNRSDAHTGVQRFEYQSNQIPFGKPVKSRYCLVTDDAYGCIHHESKQTKQ
jgi:hypothetical protein